MVSIVQSSVSPKAALQAATKSSNETAVIPRGKIQPFQFQPGSLVGRQARCLAPRGADHGPGPAVGDEISLGLEQLVGLAHGHYIDARVLRQRPGGGQPLAGGQLPLRHGQHHLIPDLAVDGHRALKIQPEQHFHSSCLY